MKVPSRKWKTKKSKLILNTKHFKVRKDLVELPTGKLTEWIYWDSLDSTMVVAITKDRKLVMIKQYRYLVGDEVIEFPAGGLHKDEDSTTGAKREFEEETGYKAKSLIKLGSFYETYGSLNRRIQIFFSPDIIKTKQNQDKGKKGFEDIKTVLINFEEAISLVLRNKIVAMGSSLAILLLQEKVKKREIIIP